MNTRNVLGIIEFLGKMLVDLIQAHRTGDHRRVEEILGSELGVVLAKRAADEAAAAKFSRRDEPTVPMRLDGARNGEGHT